MRHLPRQRFLLAAAVLVSCASLLSACDPGAFFMDAYDDDIAVKEHPQPEKTFLLTMTLANAPGPFVLVDGSAQYDVDNRHDCGRRNPSTNTVIRITHMVELRWTQVSPGVYQTVVHPDLLVDEDYFGNGVCRWKLNGVSALMRATGDRTETRFMPGIHHDEIHGGTVKTIYLWSGFYPRTKGGNFPETGESNVSRIPADRIPEYFTATLVVTEA